MERKGEKEGKREREKERKREREKEKKRGRENEGKGERGGRAYLISRQSTKLIRTKKTCAGNTPTSTIHPKPVH